MRQLSRIVDCGVNWPSPRLDGCDYTITSETFVEDIAARGGLAVNCDHGGGHCAAPPEVVDAQWQFLKDHPFGVETDPYADGLPESFPSYCEVVQ